MKILASDCVGEHPDRQLQQPDDDDGGDDDHSTAVHGGGDWST